MDSQIFVEYELSEPISGRVMITASHEEASAYFEDGWMVVEYHTQR